MPQEIQIRHIADDDLLAVARILNESNEGSYEYIPFSMEFLRESLISGEVQAFIALKDHDVMGVMAYASPIWGEEIAWHAFTKSKNNLAMRLLLEKIEACAKGNRLNLVIDDLDPEIEKWESCGFNREDGVHHMISKLDTPIPFPQFSEKITLRHLESGEEYRMVGAVNRAFGWNRLKMGDLDCWKREDPEFSEEWVQVAEIDGILASVTVSQRDIAYNAHFNKRRGYIGPAATIPEYRSMGLATLTTVYALNFLQSKGMDSVALYTHDHNAAPIHILQKIGFESCHHWTILRKYLQ